MNSSNEDSAEDMCPCKRQRTGSVSYDNSSGSSSDADTDMANTCSNKPPSTSHVQQSTDISDSSAKVYATTSNADLSCQGSAFRISANSDEEEKMSQSGSEDGNTTSSRNTSSSLTFQSDSGIYICDSTSISDDDLQRIKPKTFSSTFHVNSFPDHVILQIFKHLSMFELVRKASCVCKHWNRLSQDPELWRVLSLRGQDRVGDDVLLRLTSLSDRVLYLDITDSKSITDVGLQIVLKKCNHLQTLKLGRCYRVDWNTFGLIGEYCHYMETLNLELCHRLIDDDVVKIAKGCPRMKELHLSQCRNLTDRSLLAVAEHCHQLKQLYLDYNDQIKDTGILAIIDKCPDMEILNMMNLSEVTDRSIKHLAKLKKLRVLDISNNNENVIVSSIVNIVKSCDKLDSLNISLSSVITDDCIEQIAKYGKNLKRLYCVACSITDKALEYIGGHSKTIETLDVAWCEKITDDGVSTLSATCPSLRYLGLIRCDSVTTERIDELVSSYPHISYSTFVLESRKMLAKARLHGFVPSSEHV